MDEQALAKRKLEGLKEEAKRVEANSLNLERNVDKAKKELREIEEKKKKELAQRDIKYSETLTRREGDVIHREVVLNRNEQNFERRSQSLEVKEMKFVQQSDKDKELRNKALNVESRRIDAEKLWNKAVNLEAEGKTKLAEATKINEENRKKETEVANHIQELFVKKEELRVTQEDYKKGKDNYELIKEEIDPKIEKLKAQTALMEEKEKKLKVREDTVNAQTIENGKIKEYLVKQKEDNEAETTKLKEYKIDLDNKALSMKLRS